MKLDLGNPQKFSFLYFFLHHTWFRTLFCFWYKRIQVSGMKNLYAHKTTIVAPNHQNTAMDALVVLGVSAKPIVWLARADMFQSNVARPVLQFMKIMPVFRQRDGLKALANNEKVFEKCVEVLEYHKMVALFPEATHWGFRRLRETKKAVPRIAFLAEETHDFTLDVHIVPTGIYYENYQNPRTNLLINFGTPIPVAQFQELYNENPQQAQQELKEAIDAGMREQMLCIQHFDDEYDAYDLLRYICADEVEKRFEIQGKYLQKRFNVHKKVVELLDTAEQQMPGIHTEIMEKTKAYKQNLQQTGYRDWVVAQQTTSALHIVWNVLVLVAALPVFAIGYVLHGYLFYAFAAIARKAAKDKQFRSTITFGLSFLLLPIVYAGYSLVWIFFVHMPAWSLVPFLVGIFASALWSYDYAVMAKKTYKALIFNMQRLKNNPAIVNVIQQRYEIVELFKKTLK
ncbi:MAG: 1-acyl-sn-glycerol-3-phosphate acyltransferase [Bacteroidales bacterium]|jgi:1-acyl-sn-glycerol-3-phosphate acyltransferase|nr:1-acyl-sn-glycerol-3-phosphate acyltransferase [Bacteroidales bacterium]